jgi:hypothetical protein
MGDDPTLHDNGSLDRVIGADLRTHAYPATNRLRWQRYSQTS